MVQMLLLGNCSCKGATGNVERVLPVISIAKQRMRQTCWNSELPSHGDESCNSYSGLLSGGSIFCFFVIFPSGSMVVFQRCLKGDNCMLWNPSFSSQHDFVRLPEQHYIRCLICFITFHLFHYYMSRLVSDTSYRQERGIIRTRT